MGWRAAASIRIEKTPLMTPKSSEQALHREVYFLIVYHVYTSRNPSGQNGRTNNTVRRVSLDLRQIFINHPLIFLCVVHVRILFLSRLKFIEIV